MIKNVVFDMGNVLRYYKPEWFIDRIGITDEEDRALLLKHVFYSTEWVLQDWGTLDEYGLEAAALSRLPERLHDAARKLIHHWDDPVIPIPGMAELVRDCKAAGLGVYLLSNASPRLREYFPQTPGSEYFDGIVVSAELHWVKPMPEIFRYLLDKYQLKAEECIFIDDVALNVSGAMQLGMRAFLFDGDVDAVRRAIFDESAGALAGEETQTLLRNFSCRRGSGPLMGLVIEEYTRDRIPAVLEFERRLREEEDVWGWEIDEDYIRSVERSFEDPAFGDSISLLAYEGGAVVGRIDAACIASHFDGSRKAYLDWICVLKSCRHRGVAQRLMEALRQRLGERHIDTLIALTAANDEAQRFYRNIPNSKMRDVGIWIDVSN